MLIYADLYQPQFGAVGLEPIPRTLQEQRSDMHLPQGFLKSLNIDLVVEVVHIPAGFEGNRTSQIRAETSITSNASHFDYLPLNPLSKFQSADPTGSYHP
jgi:hypothetical protein